MWPGAWGFASRTRRSRRTQAASFRTCSIESAHIVEQSTPGNLGAHLERGLELGIRLRRRERGSNHVGVFETADLGLGPRAEVIRVCRGVLDPILYIAVERLGGDQVGRGRLYRI